MFELNQLHFSLIRSPVKSGIRPYAVICLQTPEYALQKSLNVFLPSVRGVYPQVK